MFKKLLRLRSKSAGRGGENGEGEAGANGGGRAVSDIAAETTRAANAALAAAAADGGGSDDKGGQAKRSKSIIEEVQQEDVIEDEEDDEEALGATDTDGLRARRARFSLDDVNIRSQPSASQVQIAESNDGTVQDDDAEDRKPVIADRQSETAEGRICISTTSKLPLTIGTCGMAGWEPLRGVNRRRSVEIRKENQDAYLALAPFGEEEDQMIFGVFDGHGAEGRRISHNARDIVCKQLAEFHSNGKAEYQRRISDDDSESQKAEAHKARAESLKRAFQRAETDLDRPELGTNGGKLKAVELSSDQKPSRSDEKRRVKSAGGRIARWRRDTGPLRVWLPTDWDPGLAMTRSIGDTILSPYGVIPVPEVSYSRLSVSDSFIILASDGVWEFMSSQEAVDFVGARREEKMDPNAAAEALVREAVKRWRKHEAVVDDTTAVLVYLDFTDPLKREGPKGLFSFGKSAYGIKPMLVSEEGKLSSFSPKNDDR